MRMATEDPALFHADLTDIIKTITGNRKRSAFLIAVLPVLFYAGYMGFFILVAAEQSIGLLVSFLAIAATLISTTFVGFGISGAIAAQRKKRLAECITDIDDLNALPALIELLEFTNPAVRNAILPPITRLLSRLRSSDAHLLGFIHRTALARTLNMPRSQKLPAAFFVSVLQAFEHIGDSQVLPTVSWLAQGKGAAGKQPEIQVAAQACQTYLQEQLRRHQAPYLLLRPSSLALSSHALLRPVATAPDSAPHELLRADKFHQEQAASVQFRPQKETEETLPLHIRAYEEP
ncbi:MAG: hypothetical protein JWN14_3548 [Chthonomonadales bacterium]|nr:hypothetical protein [Chthonomonadales bacterium]